MFTPLIKKARKLLIYRLLNLLSVIPERLELPTLRAEI